MEEEDGLARAGLPVEDPDPANEDGALADLRHDRGSIPQGPIRFETVSIFLTEH